MLENLSTHTTPDVQARLQANPHVQFRFTPKGSSRINQIETWFGIIIKQAIRRGGQTERNLGSSAVSGPNRTVTCRVPNSCPTLRAAAILTAISGQPLTLHVTKAPSQSSSGFVFQAGHLADGQSENDAAFLSRVFGEAARGAGYTLCPPTALTIVGRTCLLSAKPGVLP